MGIGYQSQWIGGEPGGGDRGGSGRPGGKFDESWMLHGLGCVWMTRKRNVLEIRLDGRLLDEARCGRLLDEIGRHAGRVDRYEFAVWSGISPPGVWVRYTARTAADARRHVNLVWSVATAADPEATISATPLRFERLLLERRGVFDEVVAAWLLDRRPDAAAIGRLFDAGRERMDEGLKIVRRFGGNLVFGPYRAPGGHSWTSGQAARMTGSDLQAVPDRRMAETLRRSAAAVAASRAPVLERIRGILLVERGPVFSEYFRLSLPLSLDDQGLPDSMLIATRW